MKPSLSMKHMGEPWNIQKAQKIVSPICVRCCVVRNGCVELDIRRHLYHKERRHTLALNETNARHAPEGAYPFEALSPKVLNTHRSKSVLGKPPSLCNDPQAPKRPETPTGGNRMGVTCVNQRKARLFVSNFPCFFKSTTGKSISRGRSGRCRLTQTMLHASSKCGGNSIATFKKNHPHFKAASILIGLPIRDS